MYMYSRCVFEGSKGKYAPSQEIRVRVRSQAEHGTKARLDISVRDSLSDLAPQ